MPRSLSKRLWICKLEFNECLHMVYDVFGSLWGNIYMTWTCMITFYDQPCGFTYFGVALKVRLFGVSTYILSEWHLWLVGMHLHFRWSKVYKCQRPIIQRRRTMDTFFETIKICFWLTCFSELLLDAKFTTKIAIWALPLYFMISGLEHMMNKHLKIGY